MSESERDIDFDFRPALLRTLAFFDLSNYPLTPQELISWMIADTADELPGFIPSLGQIMDILDTMPQVASRNGLYFLRRAESRAVHMLAQRLERYDIAEQKWQVLMPKVKFLATLPFVCAIFVVNTLAWSNSRADSDVDLCIVTAPHKIWTARQYVTGWAALKHDRPSKTKEKNTLCLSLYLDNTNLDFAPVRVTSQDVHLAMWFAQFHPVYDPEHIHMQLNLTNSWVRDILPYSQPVIPDARRVIQLSKARQTCKSVGEILQIPGTEQLFKKIQLRIMPKELKQLANSPGVVISDSMLKFHDKDPRKRLHQEWQNSLQSISRSSPHSSPASGKV